MTTILFTLLIIAFCFVFVYDYAQFPRNASAHICSILFKRDIQPHLVKLPKLLECSFCATTWTSLIYLLIVAPEWFFLCFLAAFSTKYILYMIETLDLIITKVFTFIQKLLT